MTQLKPGDSVTVTYTGTIERISPSGYRYVVMDSQDDRHYYSRGADVRLELLEPANWPPQAGDVWAAEGKQYFIRDSSGFGLLALEAAGIENLKITYFKDRRPELRYRSEA